MEARNSRLDTLQGEINLTLRARSQILVNGQTRFAGEIFELPERQALGLVGTGGADQIPDSGPVPPSTETGPMERGCSQGSPHAGVPGSANWGQQVSANPTIPNLQSGTQGGFDTLRPTAGGGTVGNLTVTGGINAPNLPAYNNNPDALAGGLQIGDFYEGGGIVHVTIPPS